MVFSQQMCYRDVKVESNLCVIEYQREEVLCYIYGIQYDKFGATSDLMHLSKCVYVCVRNT